MGDDKHGRSVALSLSNEKDDRTILRKGKMICPWMCGEEGKCLRVCIVVRDFVCIVFVVVVVVVVFVVVVVVVRLCND